MKWLLWKGLPTGRRAKNGQNIKYKQPGFFEEK